MCYRFRADKTTFLSVFDQRQVYLSSVPASYQEFFQPFAQNEDVTSLGIALIEQCLADEGISAKVKDNMKYLKLVLQGSRILTVSCSPCCFLH